MAKRSIAYQSEDFIHSVEARPVRILAECAEPLARFHRHGVIDTIVFMGSARFLSREAAEAQIAAVHQQSSDEAEIRMAEQALANAAYYEAARQLAFRLTTWAKETKPQRYIVWRPSKTWGWSCRSPKRTPSPSFCGGMIVIESAVDDGCANFEHQVSTSRRPTHLLLGCHPTVQKPLHRAFGG